MTTNIIAESDSANVSIATKRQNIISKFARVQNDTGSPEVQIALLTDRITCLTKHFEKHRGDKHSMRGMARMISLRKRLLKYLRVESVDRYKSILAELNLRK
jgi:small subunit ribosomal protein S15